MAACATATPQVAKLGGAAQNRVWMASRQRRGTKAHRLNPLRPYQLGHLHLHGIKKARAEMRALTVRMVTKKAPARHLNEPRPIPIAMHNNGPGLYSG
jgi:hypothetical protein